MSNTEQRALAELDASIQNLRTVRKAIRDGKVKADAHFIRDIWSETHALKNQALEEDFDQRQAAE